MSNRIPRPRCYFPRDTLKRASGLCLSCCLELGIHGAPPSIVPMRICCSLLSSSCSHTLLMCQRPASYPLGCRPISLPAHSAAASLGLERRSGGDLFTLVPPKIQRQGPCGPGEEKGTTGSVMMRE